MGALTLKIQLCPLVHTPLHLCSRNTDYFKRSNSYTLWSLHLGRCLCLELFTTGTAGQSPSQPLGLNMNITPHTHTHTRARARPPWSLSKRILLLHGSHHNSDMEVYHPAGPCGLWVSSWIFSHSSPVLGGRMYCPETWKHGYISSPGSATTRDGAPWWEHWKV